MGLKNGFWDVTRWENTRLGGGIASVIWCWCTKLGSNVAPSFVKRPLMHASIHTITHS